MILAKYGRILCHLLAICLVIAGCNHTRILTLSAISEARFPEIYPSSEVEVEFHGEWTRQHYKERIKNFKKTPLSEEDIVFIGDSITEGGGDWGKRFNIKNIKNRGISGDVSDGVLLRIGEVLYFQPKAIFLMIGFNDVNNIHYQKQIPSTEYVTNTIIDLTHKLGQGSPGTQVFVQSILPCDRAYINTMINDINTALALEFRESSIVFIDLHSHFKDKHGKMLKHLTYDGVHLNEMGYQLWTKQVYPFVKGLQ
tara:strand:- start:2737 stop:3498 length:762 start_codon:yes stop_codon:yes gene_type:complete